MLTPLCLGLLLVQVTAVDAGVASEGAPARSLLSPIFRAPSTTPSNDYQLRRASDGSGDFVYEATAFSARIARDGSVSFHDKHLTLSTILTLPFRPRTYRPPIMGVPSLEAIIRGHGTAPPPPSPDVQQESSVNYGARLPIPTVTPFRPDSREACRYPDPCFFAAAAVLVSVSATFDLTDELMRATGQDPYRFAKARFLAGTQELRIRLAARGHADELRRSIADLPERLTTIACDDRLTLAERRAILQALRTELDTSSAAGHEAQEIIGRFLEKFDRAGGALACTVR